jgi:hypothetical protein
MVAPGRRLSTCAGPTASSAVIPSKATIAISMGCTVRDRVGPCQIDRDLIYYANPIKKGA